MDLIRQNRLVGWVIAILVCLNILTLTILWLKPGASVPGPTREEGGTPPGTAGLMQRAIGFTDDQAARYEAMRKDYQEATREINDSLATLKRRIADELFAQAPDGVRVDSMAAAVGVLQARIEHLRFEHFRGVVQICTPEQREKLRPVLREVFGRKPPKERPVDEPLRQGAGDVPGVRGRTGDGQPPTGEGRPEVPPPGEERPRPPSREEKLQRYTASLSLTPDQVGIVGGIMDSIRAAEEAFKERVRPSEERFEQEKQALRRVEDERIMQVLDEAQKRDFERMLRDRGRKKPQGEPR